MPRATSSNFMTIVVYLIVSLKRRRGYNPIYKVVVSMYLLSSLLRTTLLLSFVKDAGLGEVSSKHGINKLWC